jgi:hypothetical protein
MVTPAREIEIEEFSPVFVTYQLSLWFRQEGGEAITLP